jgi:hypothetical protein
VTNVTETCDPDNEVQLIVKVQTAPNNTDDGHLLEDALPNLVARTEVEEMYTDGGYNGPTVDEALNEQGIGLTQTAIRGAQPDPDTLSLADFTWKTGEQGVPVQVTCPGGETANVQPARAEDRYTARFDATACEDCPLGCVKYLV